MLSELARRHHAATYGADARHLEVTAPRPRDAVHDIFGVDPELTHFVTVAHPNYDQKGRNGIFVWGLNPNHERPPTLVEDPGGPLY
jgi:hypothetical protein